jgi:two-component system sensor histidine kinase YesM
LQYQTVKLILQPIVENALYHGIEMMPDEGLDFDHAELKNKLIIIRVSDNGLGMSVEMMNT